ncbi:MAG: hypothetical protein AB4040_08590 [Synechococcus sp.]
MQFSYILLNNLDRPSKDSFTKPKNGAAASSSGIKILFLHLDQWEMKPKG